MALRPNSFVTVYTNTLYVDEILKFNADTDEWILAGKMNIKRESHAPRCIVSTINFEDVSEHCPI